MCVRENQTRWREENREHYRTYRREWARKKRANERNNSTLS
jgi:hypothetical protein